MSDNPLHAKVYLVTEAIPSGQVATYGDIAAIIGGGCTARDVGEALSALPQALQDQVPWQRVIAKDGVISTRGLRQAELLRAEGVTFDDLGQVLLARHHWRGPDAAWAAEHGMHPLPPRTDTEQLRLF